MAEQRKRQEEEREKMKSDKRLEKEQIKKKYKKGKGDKNKDKGSFEQDSKDSPAKSQPTEHKMVNLEIEPEIIEPSDSMVLGGTQPRNRSGSKKKSILHNKDEHTPVAEKAAELPHKPIKPLDDVELKKLHESQGANPGSPSKRGKGQGQAQFKEEVKEVVKETKAQKTKATPVRQEVVETPVEEKKMPKTKSAPGGKIFCCSV